METEQRRPSRQRGATLVVTAVYTHYPRSAFEALYLREHVSQREDNKTQERRSKIKLEIARRNSPSSSPCLII